MGFLFVCLFHTNTTQGKYRINFFKKKKLLSSDEVCPIGPLQKRKGHRCLCFFLCWGPVAESGQCEMKQVSGAVAYMRTWDRLTVFMTAGMKLSKEGLEKVQQLAALSAPSEDLNWWPAPTWLLTTSSKILGDDASDMLLWPPQALGMHMVHRHTCNYMLKHVLKSWKKLLKENTQRPRLVFISEIQAFLFLNTCVSPD